MEPVSELRHENSLNLRLRQLHNLRPALLFLKNLRSAAAKNTQSSVCGNAYAPHKDLSLIQYLHGSRVGFAWEIQFPFIFTIW